MHTKARIAVLMIVFATSGWATPSEHVEETWPAVAGYQSPNAGGTLDDPPGLVFVGATEAQADKMFWAIDRFRDSGLELPSLEVHFAEGCQERFGAWGRIKLDSAPPWRVEVCTTAVYLHELAHAWDRWNLTDTDRRVFLDLRGLEAWQGKAIPWKERGQEELASLVARVLGQGVNNHPSAEQLTDFRDFEQITGVPVPVVRTVDPAGPQSEAPGY